MLGNRENPKPRRPAYALLGGVLTKLDSLQVIYGQAIYEQKQRILHIHCRTWLPGIFLQEL